MRRAWALITLLAAGTACNKDPGAALPPPGGEDAGVAAADTGPGARYTWWQDVEPIVRQRCQLCHAAPPQFGAPRPLVTYQDTQLLTTRGEKVHELMAYRVIAPQNAMPPPSQQQLSPMEKEIIRRWSEIGAPEGTPPAPDAGEAADAGVHPDAAPGADAAEGTDGAVPQDSGVPPPTDAGTRVLEFLANDGAGGAYAVPQRNTTYTCWSFEAPAAPNGLPEEYAIRFEPVIDNTAHLHHLLLFRNSAGAQAAGPFDCGSFPLEWVMVAGWAPGRMADELPAGVGVKVQAGDQFILQAHYDSVTSAGQTDASGMRVLMSAEQGMIPAGILWSGYVWGAPINGANASRTGTCNVTTPITIFNVFPHMHQLGRQITLEVRRAGQSSWTMLVDINPWSFNDQPNVPIAAAEQSIMPGDQLRTTCRWDTQGRSVSFGEASNDEMCFNFIYHYPLLQNDHLCVSLGL